MKFQIEMTPSSLADLQKLDQTIANRIATKLRFFAQQENPLRFAERLTDSPYGEYRFRIGDYRGFAAYFLRSLGKENEFSFLSLDLKIVFCLM